MNKDLKKELYDLMDWSAIEAIVYADEDHPRDILGPHLVNGKLLVQCFFPEAKRIQLQVMEDRKTYEMERQDDAGYYAVLLPYDRIVKYQLKITVIDKNEKSSVITYLDPYAFPCQISEDEAEAFNKGFWYNCYEKIGAHPMTVDGVKGTYFAVWAPNAKRVSVVGDFVLWDGKRLPMHKMDSCGIFELFVPDELIGKIYKFELRAKGGLTYLKADPYANMAELRPNDASIVTDIRSFKWTDKKWMENRIKENRDEKPMAIYELHLGSWKKPQKETTQDGEETLEFYNYREIAPLLADYIKQMGYTHIELLPIMEHPLDESWGYQVTGYYAPTSRFGTPQDFMYFMNYMHSKGIGVILDWVPGHFPKNTVGLAAFDGTCLYEHLDPRQGQHPHWGTLIYNYGRPQVKNFLIANALYWIKKYHADGIRVDAVASMLYLDYGKQNGEWVANKYGGNQNLEAIEFIKHLNSIVDRIGDGAFVAAEESTAWPKITGSLQDNGLGFSYKWNMGWMHDVLEYMSLDPYFRAYNHNNLTFGITYTYSEKFILPFSHDEVTHSKGSMINKMPGKLENKFANLRTTYGYMMAYPGKKLMFMGQEFGQFDEWNEKKEIQWSMMQYDHHRQMQQYTADLLKLYRTHPCMYEKDFVPDGFEWMSCNNASLNMLSFVRKGKDPEDILFFVLNFAPVEREKFQIGVPMAGKYREIFSSDDVKYGGTGAVNPRWKASKRKNVDGRENCIEIKMAPMSMAAYSYKPFTEKEKEAEEKKAAAAAKKREDARLKREAEAGGKRLFSRKK